MLNSGGARRGCRANHAQRNVFGLRLAAGLAQRRWRLRDSAEGRQRRHGGDRSRRHWSPSRQACKYWRRRMRHACLRLGCGDGQCQQHRCDHRNAVLVDARGANGSRRTRNGSQARAWFKRLRSRSRRNERGLSAQTVNIGACEVSTSVAFQGTSGIPTCPRPVEYGRQSYSYSFCISARSSSMAASISSPRTFLKRITPFASMT